MRLSANAFVWIAVIAEMALPGGPAVATVVTDGSVGPAKSLSGPNYIIGAGLGTLMGNNLFQSFSTFGLAKGQSATFTGPSTLANIIARVTGGSASSIDGQIATLTGGKPNLFLINPAGVVFGLDASLNVEGSFHISTADYLKFADGAMFLSSLGKGSSFTIAAPAAFGFLSAHPASLTARGANLSVAQGQQLDLSGGGVTLANAIVSAPAGAASVTSVAGAGTIPVTPGAAPTATPPSYGAMRIAGSAVSADAGRSAPHGGSLYIRGGKILVSGGSQISANNAGSGAGGTISLKSSDDLTVTNGSAVESISSRRGTAGNIQVFSGKSLRLLDGAMIASNTTGVGAAGSVSVTAGNIVIDDENSQVGTVIGSASRGGTGNAGSVEVTSSTGLAIRSGGSAGSAIISSEAHNHGASGSVTVSAGSLFIDGGNSSNSSGTGIVTGTAANSPTAAGGQVTVSIAGKLNLRRGGEINSGFGGAGNAGAITIGAGDIWMTGGTASVTGIFAKSFASGGIAGSISIHASGDITLRSDPFAGDDILTSTKGEGSGGDISISARSLTIEGGNSFGEFQGYGSLIAVQHDSGSRNATNQTLGQPGQINLQVSGPLQILNSGRIESDTSVGPGGNISINAGSILIAATNKYTPASIISQTQGNGNAGNISIQTGSMTMIGYATDSGTGIAGISSVSSSNQGKQPRGNTGNVTIDVLGNFRLSNGAVVETNASGAGAAGAIVIDTGELQMYSGRFGSTEISTTVNGRSGQAGNITVDARGGIEMSAHGDEEAAISSAAFGRGNGGNVSVAADSMTMQGVGLSGILADGAGRQITVTVKNNLQFLNGGSIESDSSAGAAGSISVNAGTILLDGGGYISSSALGPVGNGGDVTLKASKGVIIRLDRQSISFGRPGTAYISADTNGNGKGGDISITAPMMVIDAANQSPGLVNRTGISAASLSDTLHGDAGHIDIQITDTLKLLNGGAIESTTAGAGAAGSINISAHNILLENNITGDTPLVTEISTDSMCSCKSDAGQITITATGRVEVGSKRGPSYISSETEGKGSAGSITIVDPHGLVDLTGTGGGILTSSNLVNGRGGASGDIGIIAQKLRIDGNNQISTSTFSSGNGGKITIDVGQSLMLANSADITAESYFTGDSGSITVQAFSPGTQAMVSLSAASQIAAGSIGAGNAGSVTVTANTLTLSGGSLLSSATAATSSGNAGTVQVTVAGSFSATGQGGGLLTTASGTGSAGSVTLVANTVSLTNSAAIASNVGTAGNPSDMGSAGGVVVTARDSLSISGVGSAVSADALGPDSGTAGTVTVSAPTLTIVDSGAISSTAAGAGKGGDITVSANDLSLTNGAILADGSGAGGAGSITVQAFSAGTSAVVGLSAASQIAAASTGAGNAGSVTLTAGSVSLTGGSVLSSATAATSSGDAGTIQVTVAGSFSATGQGGGLLTTASGSGSAGSVTLVANTVALTNGAVIASNVGTAGNPSDMGSAGGVTVRARGALSISGVGSAISANALGPDSGTAGTVTVSAPTLTIVDSGAISSTAAGAGKGGDITASANDLSLAGGSILADASGAGGAGSITVQAFSPGTSAVVGLSAASQIAAASTGAGNAGSVTVTANTLTLSGGSLLSSATAATSSGNAGTVQVTVAGSFSAAGQGGGLLTTASGSGSAGAVTLVANTVSLTNGAVISSDAGNASVQAETGSAGAVTVTAAGRLSLSGAGTAISANTLDQNSGVAGTVTVAAPEILISNSALIGSSAAGTGKGGDLTVAVNNLELADGFIRADSSGKGDAGSITVQALATGILPEVSLSAGSQLSAASSGSGNAGSVVLMADNLTLSGGSALSSATMAGATGNAGTVSITVNKSFSADGAGGGLLSYALGAGNGGDVKLDAGSVSLTNGAVVSSDAGAAGQLAGVGTAGVVTVTATGQLSLSGSGTAISANTLDSNSGAAGTVTVGSPRVRISDGALIGSSAAGVGKGGDVTISADNLELAGGLILADASGTGGAGSITVQAFSPGTQAVVSLSAASQVAAASTGAGNAGSVTVTANTLTLSGGSILSSATAATSSGNAGTVQVTVAGSFSATGQGGGLLTTASGTGSAGSVTLVANTVSLTNGAVIASNVGTAENPSDMGSAGGVMVTARDALSISGAGTAISANALGSESGTAGTVTVSAPMLTIVDGGAISSTAAGVGKGGDIVVSANSLAVDGGLIKADSSASGGAGALSINAGTITLTGGALLSAEATGAGPAGDITIDAANMTIDQSSISTQSKSGGGGNLTVTVPGLLAIDGGGMTTAVQGGDLNAGNVTVRAGLLLLDSSQLSANAYGGRGGNILIVADGILATPDSAISASSAKGVSGTVALESLASDVTAGLAPLSGKLGIAENVSPLACGIRVRGREKQSTLVLRGRGRLPADGEGPLDLPYGGGTAWMGPVGSVFPLAPESNRAALPPPCG